MIDLANRLHQFDMANTRRGSHHADGLARMQDLVAGPIADVLALGEGDRRDAEIAKLQEALCRWLPHVSYEDDPAGEDAFLLVGYMGDSDAPELGESNRMDAERYRWLREHAGAFMPKISGDHHWYFRHAELTGSSLDRAIDAAMTPTRPESV